MEKYKKKLINNIRTQLDDWFDKEQFVNHSDLYRFLHSITGTAATVGMGDLGDTAKKLMESIKENESKTWSSRELQEFLIEIITQCYHYDSDQEIEIKEQKVNESNQPTVMVIDDDLSLLMYIKEELEKEGWYVFAVADPEKAITSFYDVLPDCIIIDVMMEGKNGFEILSFLKEKMKQQFVPTIMMSADDRKVVRMKSFLMGADDFIAKPFELDEFYVRIARHIERKKLIDNLLLIDELTRAYNRKYLTQLFEQLDGDLSRRKEPFSVVMVDLDHFKGINDTYGHLMGDEVLRAFTSFVKEQLRTSDSIVRYGGEEFIILLPETGVHEAEVVTTRILSGFSNIIFEHETNEFSCTFSSGIVEVNQSGELLEKWLELADNALYEAKDAGRNTIKIADQQFFIPHKKQLKVAIVDDDPIIRTILVDIIENLGEEGNLHLDIHAFKDGTAFFASNWNANDEQSLVILDGVMPKMDGLEVLQKLRNDKRHDKYTVIMLTSRKSERDISRALQLGADDYLTKPFKLLELETRIRHLLKRMK
ncbi:diguanylate cyclase [Bacillus timonensis]|nr:diguanylate cyclase [Bacillus timonensis]